MFRYEAVLMVAPATLSMVPVLRTSTTLPFGPMIRLPLKFWGLRMARLPSPTLVRSPEPVKALVPVTTRALYWLEKVGTSMVPPPAPTVMVRCPKPGCCSPPPSQLASAPQLVEVLATASVPPLVRVMPLVEAPSCGLFVKVTRPPLSTVRPLVKVLFAAR
jgi:hypothetical protein